MQIWLEVAEFSKLIHLDILTIEDMINRGKFSVKEENGKLFIEASLGTGALIATSKTSHQALDSESVTLGAILGLHEKVMDAKDETLDALKSENRFLKEALLSMQELVGEDRKIVETLTKQLEISQEELEFAKRKHNLMWKKTVENYKKD